MKKIFIIFAMMVIGSLAMAATHTLDEMLADQVVPVSFGQRERVVARHIIDAICENHYDHPQITSSLSARWFENFFQTIDRDKTIFTQNDIDSFRNYETNLCHLKSLSTSLEFAAKVNARFMERIQEKAAFLAKYYETEPDFSVDEYLPIDYKNEAWAANDEELKDRWRKRAKFILLSDMVDRETREASDEAKAGDEKQEDATSPEPKKDIRQRSIQNLINYYYMRKDFNSLELLEPYFNAFCSLFDPHSEFMAPDTSDEFNISMSLSLQGIGATLSNKDSFITIEGLIAGSPAERSGQLHEGDRILAVAQGEEEAVSVVDMPLNRAVRLIRGSKGSTVRLTIQPKNSNREIEVVLIRDEIKLDDRGVIGKTHIIEMPDQKTANILTISLPIFYHDFQAQMKGNNNFRSTSIDMAKLIIEEEEKRHIDGIILDLRGNGGGSLDEAIQLPGLFVNDNLPVVQIRSSREITVVPTEAIPLVPTQPVIILTDSGSASASEIVAAFFQDSHRGLLIGDNMTHGKGTVQNLLPVQSPIDTFLGKHKNDNGSVKITTQKFYRISGGSTQLRGVTPDITFPSAYDCLDCHENSLPNAMPWDNISPSDFTSYQPKWLDHMDELQAAADNFAQNDPNYQAYQKFVKEFIEYQNIKMIPLELEKYREYQKMETEMTEQLKQLLPSRQRKQAGDIANKLQGGVESDLPAKDDTSSKDAQSPEDDLSSDPVLNAAHHVMAEMLKY